MNHLCQCGHPPRDHYADTGHCEAPEHTLWGEATCKCPIYQKDDDD